MPSAHSKRIGAILAAGAATRFGSAKQLARFEERTLIEIAVEAITESQVDEICIILGANANEIEAHLKTKHFSRCHTILLNEDWKTGMASSIRTATEFAIKSDASHLLLASCDQPFVDELLFDKLLDASSNPEQIATPNASSTASIDAARDEMIVACKYGNTIGIPACFPDTYFTELLTLSGDKGAKAIIQKSNALIVDCPEAAIDIDTKEALARRTQPY